MRALQAVFLSALLGACAAPAAADEPPRAPSADGSTPRRALRHFIASCRAGHYDEAALDLDLEVVPSDLRARGPVLARRLKLVLDQTLWIDWEKIPDDPLGSKTSPGLEPIGSIALADDAVPVVLVRKPSAGGHRWLVAASTVGRIPELHAAHGPPAWLDDRIPEALFVFRFLELEGWQWLGFLAALIVSVAGGRLAAWGILRAVDRLARHTAARWDERLVGAVKPPLRHIISLLALRALAEPLRLAVPVREALAATISVLLGLLLGWLGTRLVCFVAETAEEMLTKGVTDESRVRGVKTQVLVLRRVASVLVMLVASALVLTRFEVVRTVGMSVLASAGVAGIVLGLAAQRTIATLLAGIQISITQPIRIGDTVIVEGEWGWIEEIHLTYVVVKVWDLRRLVVPINRFLEHPFQNWTKVAPDIMGTVELFADYAAPVDAVRAELARVCSASPLWDGKVCGLQVTGVSPQTITLRALVSSSDAGKNWDLRCEVREKLVAFLKNLEGGRYLPRARVDRATAASVAEAAAEPESHAQPADAALLAAAVIVDGHGPGP